MAIELLIVYMKKCQ